VEYGLAYCRARGGRRIDKRCLDPVKIVKMIESKARLAYEERKTRGCGAGGTANGTVISLVLGVRPGQVAIKCFLPTAARTP
jgi:hypothetical protein